MRLHAEFPTRSLPAWAAGSPTAFPLAPSGQPSSIYYTILRPVESVQCLSGNNFPSWGDPGRATESETHACRRTDAPHEEHLAGGEDASKGQRPNGAWGAGGCGTGKSPIAWKGWNLGLPRLGSRPDQNGIWRRRPADVKPRDVGIALASVFGAFSGLPDSFSLHYGA